MQLDDIKDYDVKPPFRKLKAYAFDPSLSIRMDTAEINDLIYKVPWEDLIPGPIGEYLEVIDYDPTVKAFYNPVDLNDLYTLAQDGHEPSESNPQFHQQMVYAVAMTTIKNFERALGRKVLWASRRLDQTAGDNIPYEEYVQRLRIYPHAMRQANAYYSPSKKALLFGYFASTPADATIQMPDSLVFTCLSHDIIAHEVTHAILDGMQYYYNEPTNADVLAFHEAFADIVALFQHFTFPEVLRHQIAKTRGNLSSQNLLGQLAQQFGSAIGGHGSLRDAIGTSDEETGEWKPKEPNPEDYRTIIEPHDRGGILVAAVFEAFISIYKARTADLNRIASNGSGELPMGELNTDLAGRLAREASKSAGHVLNMCIRALDYCPPVDITFGDYLRAIITADLDLVEDDRWNYRLAFIDAFRRRGIYPEGIKTLSVESLSQPAFNLKYSETEGFRSSRRKIDVDASFGELLKVIIIFLRDYGNKIKYESDRKKIYDVTAKYIAGSYGKNLNENIQGLHQRLNNKFSGSLEFQKITGLAFLENPARVGVRYSRRYTSVPSFQIQNLRVVSRVGPQGNQINHVVFSIIQRSGVLFNQDGSVRRDDSGAVKHFTPDGGQRDADSGEFIMPTNGFEFRGGCTLIFDLEKLELKYVITKPLLDRDAKLNAPCIDITRAEAQYKFQMNMNEFGFSELSSYFTDGLRGITEPFSFLHQE